jgi:hypothetical protein
MMSCAWRDLPRIRAFPCRFGGLVRDLADVPLDVFRRFRICWANLTIATDAPSLDSLSPFATACTKEVR